MKFLIVTIKQLLQRLFRVSEPIYDDSSDCFDAMKFALKQYEEQYGQFYKHRKHIMQIIKEEPQEQDEPGITTRYSLQYLYSHKK